MKSIKNYFLKGLLYLVPLFAVIFAIYYSYNFLNGLLKPYLTGMWEYLGVLILFILITLVGYLGSVIIASPINTYFKKLLNKAPLLKTIYSSVKDLMNTFVGGKKGFSEPVLIKIQDDLNLRRIGFITSEDAGSLGLEDGNVLVYLPHSYAFSGNLFVVERKNITSIEKPSSEVMKLIISGGVTNIEDKNQ